MRLAILSLRRTALRCSIQCRVAPPTFQLWQIGRKICDGPGNRAIKFFLSRYTENDYLILRATRGATRHRDVRTCP